MPKKSTSEPIQVGELIARIMYKLARRHNRALDYSESKKYKDATPHKDSRK